MPVDVVGEPQNVRAKRCNHLLLVGSRSYKLCSSWVCYYSLLFFSAVEKQQTTSRKLHKSELEQKMLSRKLFFKSNLQNLSTLFFEQTLIKSCWYQCENHSLWLENKKSWKSNRKTLRLNINIVHHPVLSPRWIIQVFLNFPPHAMFP